MQCLNCDRETNNPKFCSVSCAAKYNNRIHIKRPRKKFYCQNCGKEALSRRLYCEGCNPMKGYDWSKRTIEDARSLSAFHARIRQMARRLFDRSGQPKRCAIRGYDKHVEICHIKKIQDFDDDATISAVNNIENLIALCANCHWELDNGLLKLE